MSKPFQLLLSVKELERGLRHYYECKHMDKTKRRLIREFDSLPCSEVFKLLSEIERSQDEDSQVETERDVKEDE